MIAALILMFVAMSFIPAGDTAGKMLTAQFAVAPVFVAFARFAVGAAIAVPVAPKGTFALLRDWRIWARGLMLTLGILSILTALKTAPIASVFAAFFIGPMISYVLSVIWLKEEITLPRTAMMVVGFAGVLLVVRPGFDAAQGLGYAVLAGMFYGIFLTASRALTPLGSPAALLTTQMIVGFVVLGPLAIWHIPEFTRPMLYLFLASGVLSGAGNFLLLFAYRMASASVVAPMVYFQLVAATLLGWAVFGDLPDAITWAGMALIVGAGVVSARLSRGAFAPARADRA